MLPYLQKRCIDILQPDCGHTGGISQMKRIATLPSGPGLEVESDETMFDTVNADPRRVFKWPTPTCRPKSWRRIANCSPQCSLCLDGIAA